jgi:hypothetical protein
MAVMLHGLQGIAPGSTLKSLDAPPGLQGNAPAFTEKTSTEM